LRAQHGATPSSPGRYHDRALTPSRSLRVAFLSEIASPLALRGSIDAGGQNVYVDEVARGLGWLGHRVDVFTRRDDPNLPEIVEWLPGVRIVHLVAGLPTPILKGDLWPLMPAIRDAFLDFALREGKGYDLAHGNFWMSGWVATELRRILGLPVVQIFHATGKTKRRHQGAADTSPDGRIAVEEAIVRNADHLIAQCPAERDELVDDYGAEPARVVTIPSAVNTHLFRPTCRDEARWWLGLDPQAPIVVYVGRMLPRKDIRNVVCAVAILCQKTALRPQLLIVGGETDTPDPVATPEIGALARLAEDLGIADRLIFTGKRQPGQAAARGVALVLRRWRCGRDDPWYEPFGLTPLEALADHLHFLLTDDAMRERMGRAARARVEREFT
jgi:hypothetical protein